MCDRNKKLKTYIKSVSLLKYDNVTSEVKVMFDSNVNKKLFVKNGFTLKINEKQVFF